MNPLKLICLFSALSSTLAACTADDDALAPDGPPVVDESEQLGPAKADGGIALGSSVVTGQQSGYRSDDPVNFSCTPGGTAEFQVTYKNTSVPWGAHLYLWRGMGTEDWCGGCEPAYDHFTPWADHQVTELKAIGPWTWRALTKSYGYAAGAGGQFLDMKFVVKIVLADGSTRWDNGGSSFGYYKVNVPSPACDASWMPWQTYDSKLKDLAITVHQ